MRSVLRSMSTWWVVLLVTGALNLVAVLGSAALVAIDEHAHPAIGDFIEVEGRQLHYLRGEAVHRFPGGHPSTPRSGPATPTLVLLHGGATSLLDMQKSLLPVLQARGHRVIAFDRPGHGYSAALPGDGSPPVQARLITAALDALGVEHAVWVGHSRAAPVVLAGLLAAQVDGAGSAPLAGVMIAGVGRASRRVPGHVSLLQTPVVGTWFAWTVIEYAGRLAMPGTVASAFAPEPVPPHYIDRTALTLSLRPAAALDDARERADVDLWLGKPGNRMNRLRRPLLIVQGTDDAVVSPAPEHARRAPGGPPIRIELLHGAGHGLLHTRTLKIVDAIGSLLDTLPGARGGT